MKPEQQQRAQELIDELDELGSASDPVHLYEGGQRHPSQKNAPTQHCVSELVDLPEYTSIHKRIWWWSKVGGMHLWVYGTLKQMVIDRGGTGKSTLAIADDPDICIWCGKPLEEN